MLFLNRFRDYWEEVFECDVDQTSGDRRRWRGGRSKERFANARNRDLCDPGFRYDITIKLSLD